MSARRRSGHGRKAQLDFCIAPSHIAAMTTLLLDTLRLSRALQDKGNFTSEQAEALAEALGEASQGDLATKTDLAGVRTEIAGLKTELKTELAGVGTEIAEGKEEVTVDGRDYLLEKPLRGDFALIKADRVDPRGNLTYRMAARNFNPLMAMAADRVLVEVNREVGLGEIDPNVVITPGLYVDRYFVTGPQPRAAIPQAAPAGGKSL